MSTNNNKVDHDDSEVKKAADNANVNKIEKNLDEKSVVGQPESLTEEQKTPFMDEKARTDK